MPALYAGSNPYFNPRSPCGERPVSCRDLPAATNFNPRSPCGERLYSKFIMSMILIFQSTLPVWGATPPHATGRTERQFQSTLPVWGATAAKLLQDHITQFQSTLPVWGATCHPCRCFRVITISIHAPRVGSDKAGDDSRNGDDISIHAPRVGSDAFSLDGTHKLCIFQSTLPVWGATDPVLHVPDAIHKFQSTLPVWGATPWPNGSWSSTT